MSKVEIWKDIAEYKGRYQVSNWGNIKSLLPIKAKPGYVRNKLLKLVDDRGYNIVSLSQKNVRRKCQVHRLVAIAFIPNPENRPQINHKNAIKNDNRVKNLEWNTPLENTRHACALGLKRNQWGELNSMAKLKRKDADKIKRLHSNGMRPAHIYKKYFSSIVNVQAVYDITQGKLWK